jgi:hypothetical protein
MKTSREELRMTDTSAVMEKLSQELTTSFGKCACILEMLHQLQPKKENANESNKKN